MVIVIGLWGLAMTVTGLAVFDLTGDGSAAWAAAMLPLLLGVTGLMPHGSWALPVVAMVWALTARSLPPAEASPSAPVAAMASPTEG